MVRTIDIISNNRDLTDYKKLPNNMLRSCGMGSETSLVVGDFHEFYHGMFGNGNVFLVSISYIIEGIVGVKYLYVQYLIHYQKQVRYKEFNLK